MCLRSIEKQKPAGTGTGWQVLRINRDDPYKNGTYSPVLFRDIHISTPGIEDTATSAFPDLEDVRIQSHKNVDVRYPLGFHIFLDEAAAQNYYEELCIHSEKFTVKKVSYRGAHTLGVQDNSPVVVATHRTIIKE